MNAEECQASQRFSDGSGEATFSQTHEDESIARKGSSGTAAAADAVHTSDSVRPRIANSKSGGTGASVKARSLAAGQVNRVVHGALPEGMSVSRDARVALQKSATISVLYLACLGDASRKATGSTRTTLNVQDIRGAMKAAGMAHLLPLMSTAAKRGRD
ncbi:hypothetical protein conserved [Leishmania donovani]|uniref:Uncharacterized protein n=3 Tax=Leishmania donovani species complex TaxID=38574 RepID=A4I803_LEIIN|nr:conserved hypothetical protein [Leishmania infantum JPCM5]XP_003863613.1 hypothetical protein, conserved [Leishmania donovani]CAC9525328.1 hypothetical_protein_-_conserved [Leishmania infantum]AYU81744.1 hypothetical protein LdCL_320025200 [Leishmania donovani]TPP43708.1 hypothetical protein CGC21_20535 [Leishmania donovani]TPP47202.1 hypothetical protein CGC20_34285 [Leishmania donovani]CAJ1991729.1 hypothetical protein conserved [Leishmania donovani]|eukprot:XP_001467872.1 conserved hypothetical protein [Leishmania infantum JPCM5]